MIRKLLLSSFLFLTTFYCQAQQPSHYILGEKELSGLDIYDLFQDEKLNYWIATNNGLYKYDGYVFKKIESEAIANSSIFGFTADQEGDIYCFNLKGQIFQIKEDEANLYFQLPDSLLTTTLSYEFDHDNKMIVATTCIIRVDGGGSFQKIYGDQGATLSPLFKTKNGDLISYDQSKYTEVRVTQEGIKSRVVGDAEQIGVAPQFLYFNGQQVGYSAETRRLIPLLSDKSFQENPESWPTLEEGKIVFYPAGKDLWVASLAGGVRIWNPFHKQFSDTFFKSNIISSFIVDNEGNCLFGTFGEGIIVVPNRNILDLVFENDEPKITQITASRNGRIFLGAQDGRLFKIHENNSPQVLDRPVFKHIETLGFIEEMNSLLLNEKSTTLIEVDKMTAMVFQMGSVKSVRSVQDSEYIISTNGGIWWLDPLLQNEYLPKTSPDQILGSYRQVQERCYSACKNIVYDRIYVSSVKGLKTFKTNDQEVEELKLDGKTIYPRDMLVRQGKVYVATLGNGILIYKDGELVDQLTTEDDLLSNNIYQLESEEKLLYCSSDKGIIVLSELNEIVLELTKSNGLSSDQTIDFEVVGDELWVVANGEVQIIDQSKIKDEDFSPKLTMEKVFVNDQFIGWKESSEFDYHQSKFVFELRSPSLRYREDISYEYRLSGIDSSWQVNPYSQNEIEYKSLPPGEYLFEAKATLRDRESETIQYRFYISAPVWERWWFIAMAIVVGLLIIFLVYRYQLNRQKRAAELQKELIASKLTAIQSQMNPHFIFNSLNSIQDLVLQKDDKNAYGYITKFATLVRKVLHQSGQDFIDIDEELKVLKVYLELEQLRFKNDLQFELRADEVEDVEIPPMIIQPFVENALKHGLLHKKGDKKLSVQFRFEEKNLVCVIEDNGIGRKKSAAIKERQKLQHDSFTIKSIQSRFEILERLYPGELGLVIDDLYEGDQAIGTRVRVTIPYRRKF